MFFHFLYSAVEYFLRFRIVDMNNGGHRCILYTLIAVFVAFDVNPCVVVLVFDVSKRCNISHCGTIFVEVDMTTVLNLQCFPVAVYIYGACAAMEPEAMPPSSNNRNRIKRAFLFMVYIQLFDFFFKQVPPFYRRTILFQLQLNYRNKFLIISYPKQAHWA